jgi:hypothetical protein
MHLYSPFFCAGALKRFFLIKYCCNSVTTCAIIATVRQIEQFSKGFLAMVKGIAQIAALAVAIGAGIWVGAQLNKRAG